MKLSPSRTRSIGDRHRARGRAIHRQLGESATLDGLGYIAHCLRRYDEALGHYRQALAICRTQGHSFLEAGVLDHIAETHLTRHQPDQARDTRQQARELYTAQHRLTDAQRVQHKLDSLDRIDPPEVSTPRGPARVMKG